MPSFLNRYATPLITGLFLISLVSGIALFFHWETMWFKGMHEWLSMVLILPFVLHIWKNWRSMLLYLPKPSFMVSMAVSLVAALAFVLPGGESGHGGPPPIAFSHQVLQNPMASVAPLFGKTPEQMAAQLIAAGYTLGDAAKSLSEIAKASGKDDMELMAVLIQP